MSRQWRLRTPGLSLVFALLLGCGEGPTIDDGATANSGAQSQPTGVPTQPAEQRGQEQAAIDAIQEKDDSDGAGSERKPVIRLPRTPITTAPPQEEEDPEEAPPVSGGTPPEETPEVPQPDDDPPAQLGDWHTQKAEAWRPLLEKYFQPKDMTWAINVINCESGGNPDALNAGSGASGLFQHLARFWDGRSKAAGWEGADIFDPEANIAVGAHLYYNGGPQHWSCKG